MNLSDVEDRVNELLNALEKIAEQTDRLASAAERIADVLDDASGDGKIYVRATNAS